MQDDVQSQKRLRVVCALLERNGRLFTVQRGNDMRHPLQWEFPGGKTLDGESDEGALRRELREELAIEVDVLAHDSAVRHDYPDLQIELAPIWCRIRSGTVTLREHAATAWVTPAEAAGMNLLPADRAILDQIARRPQRARL